MSNIWHVLKYPIAKSVTLCEDTHLVCLMVTVMVVGLVWS